MTEILQLAKTMETQLTRAMDIRHKTGHQVRRAIDTLQTRVTTKAVRVTEAGVSLRPPPANRMDVRTIRRPPTTRPPQIRAL